MRLGHEKSHSDLLDTFQTIFTNENHRDIVFTCVDGTISFHSSIISRISPLLKGLIDSISFHQSNIIFISLDNINLLTLKTLMDCIYTGSSCIVDPDILEQVEDLADLLQIEIDLFIELNNHASSSKDTKQSFIEDELNAENEYETMDNSKNDFDIKQELCNKVENPLIPRKDQVIESIKKTTSKTPKTKIKRKTKLKVAKEKSFTERKLNTETNRDNKDEIMGKSTNYLDIKPPIFNKAGVPFVPQDVIEPIDLEEKFNAKINEGNEDESHETIANSKNDCDIKPKLFQNKEEDFISRDHNETTEDAIGSFQREDNSNSKNKATKKPTNNTTKPITEQFFDTTTKEKSFGDEENMESPNDIFHRFANKSKLSKYDEKLLSQKLKVLHERNPDQIVLYNKLGLKYKLETFSEDKILSSNRIPGLIIDGKFTNLTVCIGCGLVRRNRSEKHLNKCPNNETFLNHKNIEVVKMKNGLTNLRNEDNAKLKCRLSELCTEVYEDFNLLKQHYLTMHPEIKDNSLCNLCGKSFGSRKKSSLPQHMFKKHGIEDFVPFQCDQCNDRFYQNSLLKRHVYERHSNERPFSCEICGNTFRLKEKLSRHLLIHSEARPWQCQHCEKAFTIEWTLKQHERIHLGIKPYKCTICMVGFGQRNSLNWHMKTHK